MSEAAGFTEDELETGRKLFAGEWDFVAGAGSAESLPKMQGIEVAFAGRSNVGKSSLINALTNRKALARVSDTPGRTQQLNFFQGCMNLRLVDLPGYGYAKAGRAKAEAWTEIAQAYLAGRANLARVFVLIDARHGLKDSDDGTFDLLDQAAVSYAVVLTKSDQLKADELPARVKETEAGIARRAAAFPVVFPTSSKLGTGLPELRAAIVRVMRE
ncbi:MAG TPA: ribosome biogenesis GTP-binding protein YihA/YsxC, partial [Xanthobacteraceae bacterium]|nr:ribosome biogenesis GTP-binding protein YihA/YsxC [Xanthobacteraceae bacterium]